MITVIIPAAGKGSRLKLPFSKEVLHVAPGQALIDFTFDLFQRYQRHEVEFVVVINEHKTDIVKYLSKYNQDFNISFVYQNPFEEEYIGAIKSAKHLFGENNLVLLPDTIMTLPHGVDLDLVVLKALEEKGFAFFYKQETDPHMLKTKGALLVDHEMRHVLFYEDKPQARFSSFNSYWCSFAFKKDVFDRVITFMEQTTLKKEREIIFDNTLLYLSRAIRVDEYIDLGTWPEIRRWQHAQRTD